MHSICACELFIEYPLKVSIYSRVHTKHIYFDREGSPLFEIQLWEKLQYFWHVPVQSNSISTSLSTFSSFLPPVLFFFYLKSFAQTSLGVYKLQPIVIMNLPFAWSVYVATRILDDYVNRLVKGSPNVGPRQRLIEFRTSVCYSAYFRVWHTLRIVTNTRNTFNQKTGRIRRDSSLCRGNTWRILRWMLKFGRYRVLPCTLHRA